MGLLGKIEQWLKGKKTFLVAISGIIAAIVGYADGQLTVVQLIEAIWVALGFSALRSGINNK